MTNEKPNYRTENYKTNSNETVILASSSLRKKNENLDEKTFGCSCNKECDCNVECGCDDNCGCDRECKHCSCDDYCSKHCSCDRECSCDSECECQRTLNVG